MNARKLLKFYVSLALLPTGQALAADSYRHWNFSLPIVSFGGEGVTKFEMNLATHGALGVEVAIQQEAEFLSDKEMEETNNDSLMMKGTEVSVVYSSYSNAKLLSGGFWSIGAGYRSMSALWLETPASTQKLEGIALTTDGKVQHDLVSDGATARARMGYRYVASSVPFSAGAYIGVRHYQNKFKNKETDNNSYQTASEDLRGLERRMMSRLEPGIEFGLSF
jgi:hypothetical protein